MGVKTGKSSAGLKNDKGTTMNAEHNFLNRAFQLLGLILHSLLAILRTILSALLESNASRGITL
jgi:hypothetical protein